MNHTQTEAGALAQVQPQQHAAPMVFSSSELMLSEGKMDRIIRVAEIMATGRSTVPKHLQGNIGDCMAVAMLATRWNMDPFAVAQKTHLVNGTMGYEAQLIAARINNSGVIKDRFHFEWFGDWHKIVGKFKEVTSQTKKDDNGNPKKYIVPAWDQKDEHGLGVRVWATIKGETEPRVLELLMTQARTRNSTLWTEDPKQQIAYLAQKRWSRLYTPDVILGAYTADELEDTLPRDMGPAEVVSPWPADVLEKARVAAGRGAKAYGEFWKGLGAELQQKLVKTDEHTRFKDQALQADRDRTVDAPPPAATPAAASATTANDDTGEITTTFAKVEQMLRDAKNPEALAVALDWANALGPDEEGRAGELLALHDELLAAMKGGAK